MANNISIIDGLNVTRIVHSIEDSTSVHYHQTVLSDVSEHLGVFVSGSQAAQASMHGFVVALHPSSPLPQGTLHLGKVSVDNIVKVSVDNIVAVAQSGSWAVSVSDKVSVAGRVSVDNIVAVAQSGTWTVQPGNTVNTTPWLVSVNGPLPAGTLHLGKVSVEGLAVGGGLTVSVAGAASVQAVPVAGRDSSGNVRQPLLDTDGTVKVGGFTTTPEYAFTRPTDLVPYSVGDLVASSTVAGTVIPMSWGVSRFTTGGGSLMVRKARLVTSDDNRTTDRNYRLHLFNVASTLSVTNGDNGVFAPTRVSDYLGYLDIPMHLSAATGAAGIGTPYGSEINITLGNSQVSISGFLEARVSILPASGATYITTLELIHN